MAAGAILLCSVGNGAGQHVLRWRKCRCRSLLVNGENFPAEVHSSARRHGIVRCGPVEATKGNHTAAFVSRSRWLPQSGWF